MRYCLGVGEREMMGEEENVELFRMRIGGYEQLIESRCGEASPSLFTNSVFFWFGIKHSGRTSRLDQVLDWLQTLCPRWHSLHRSHRLQSIRQSYMSTTSGCDSGGSPFQLSQRSAQDPTSSHFC